MEERRRAIIEYAAPHDRPRPVISTTALYVLAAAAVLTLASFWVVAKGASDEPYFSIRKSDAVVQVGLGAALIAIWVVWSVSVLVLAARRVISPLWSIAILWPLINAFYLAHGINGYLSDAMRYHDTGPSAPTPK